MSDGTIIEARLARGTTRPVCLLTAAEARILAWRWPRCTVTEALRREEERQEEAPRREFVRRLWGNREIGGRRRSQDGKK
jgi:hypothetical protein